MREGLTADGRAGCRRRQQLLRGAPTAPARPEALTRADVAALRNDPSPAQRAQIAAKLGRSAGELAREVDPRLVEAVLELLVRDVAKEVRKALAEAVATSSEVPPSIVRRLATDAIEVAEPVLRQSPLLTDQDLIEIVRTNAMQYALAVAGRSQVSEAVSEVLVDTGESSVVARLVGNVGARLKEETLRRVVAEFGREREVQERLVRRPELSFELVDRLVRAIAERLEWELVANHRMPLEQAQAIVRAARERSAIDLVARDHGDRQRERHLRERFQAGELGHEDLLAMLRDGDVAGFEIGVALHAREPVARVRKLLYDPDRRRLAAICLRAGFPVAHYVLVRMAIEFAEAAVDGKPPRSEYGPETIRFLQEQYLRLQAQPDAVAELCAA
jgi:uncharacterized protein (DUF2336 family)